MPNHQLPASTIPSTPPSGFSDIESLPVSLTTSPHKLVKAVRQLQAEKRTAETLSKSLRRKLDAIVNDDLVPSTQPKSKRIKSRHTHHPIDDSDDSDDNSGSSTKLEQLLFDAGHKFCMVYGPWIHSKDLVFQNDLNDDYTPADRFESEETKSQAQLREIWELLRMKLQVEDLKKTWVAKAFLEGLKAQRYNTTSRIRHQCISIFGVDESDMLRPEVRREKFRNRIGWVVDVRGNGSYSSVDVEILHRNYTNEYNPTSVFLNPILMGLYIAIIRGSTSGKEFMCGIKSNPRTETMESIHGIHNITPGAIAAVCVFARWALSADILFQPVGASTGIKYFSDYEEYLMILETGLLRKKKTIINVIKEWDRQVFPNTNTSLVGGGQGPAESVGLQKAMALLEADSEAEEDMLDEDE